MKRPLIAICLGIFFCPAVRSQALSSDVLLLSRVRRHVTEELQRLPNISCLETVFREIQTKNSRMRPLDTVRLEVRTNGTTELYASPGDRRFVQAPPISWAGSGALGDGFFGLYLRTVFLNNNASFIWKGDEEIAGRRLARWDYRIPLISSGQTFQLQDGQGRVSLHGSFWADSVNNDVVRLAVVAGDIPPSLPLSNAEWDIDYAPVVVGSETAVLLPMSADFRMTKLSGEVSRDRFAFTQCHSFAAESSIRFDAQDAPEGVAQFSAAAVEDDVRPLPAGLEIPVKLKNRISDEMAVGGLIEGVVSANVMLKGVALIAAGSPVKGRLRHLERSNEPVPFFVVGIEYTELTSGGIRYRFDADLATMDPFIGVERTLTVARSAAEVLSAGRDTVYRETISFSELPGVATFFVRGTRLSLTGEFRTVWKSRGELKGRNQSR